MVMAASVAGTHEEKGREGGREDGTFLGIGELTLVHAPRRYYLRIVIFDVSDKKVYRK